MNRQLFLYITCIDHRLLRILPEEQDGGQRKNAKLFGHFLVVDFHEINSGSIGLIVDMLDFGQNAWTLLAIIAD